jgi:hypothetical protein
MYTENPKTQGSGIICAIPQGTACPIKCADCFFQSGRSYLEPLAVNLPNMPSTVYDDQVVRVNDGQDSNVARAHVIRETERFKHKFYNTAIPRLDFPAPVVFTCNPAERTDGKPMLVEPTVNLMMVRVRANYWNHETVQKAVGWYTAAKVPVVLTFMAYYDTAGTPLESYAARPGGLPHALDGIYTYRRRITNAYWCITRQGWENIAGAYRRNPYVYTCGKDAETHQCARCGNCLREYHATIERMRCARSSQ